MVHHATPRSGEYTDQRTPPTNTRHNFAERRVGTRKVLRIAKASWQPMLCHDSVDA